MKNTKLFSFIEENEGKFLDILENLCNIESPTNDKAAVDRCSEYIVNIAKEHQWDVEILPLENAGNPVCITMNSNSKARPISFSGHLDTVHPIGLFGTPPVSRDETKMYGPGVIDCKGGVVSALFALCALESVGYTDRPVKLILQTDEETSSRNSGKKTIDFMIEKAKDSIAFINNEGATNYTDCVLKRKGIHRFCFHVKGVAAHSSKCMKGSNAILAASHMIIELEKWKDIEGITCNCGVISGGTVANTVAEECNFLADFRFLTEEEHQTLLKEVERISKTQYVPGCECTVEEISSRPGMPLLERNLSLLEKCNQIFIENGLEPMKWKMSNGGSDAAYVTMAEIPCIDNIGTIGDRCHSSEEFIYLDSLAAAAKRLALIALSL